MKKISKLIFVALVLVVISFASFVPVVSFAQEKAFLEGKTLVPCGVEKYPVVPGAKGAETGGGIVEPCQFKHIFLLLNRLVKYIFMYLVVPIAAIMFAYAGFLMLFSGGNASKSEKAKGIFMNVFIGLVIAAAAWLIINTVLNIVGFNGTAFGLEKKQKQ